MALKFGSKAFRAKYAAKAARTRKAKAKKRKNRPGIYVPPIKSRSKAKNQWNKPRKKKRVGANTYTKRGAAAKRKRLKEMIRNPGSVRKWTKVKAFRVLKGKGGKDILEVRK
jgi:hypothetical protein